jgi:hypothetical protein
MYLGNAGDKGQVFAGYGLSVLLARARRVAGRPAFIENGQGLNEPNRGHKPGYSHDVKERNGLSAANTRILWCPSGAYMVPHRYLLRCQVDTFMGFAGAFVVLFKVKHH